MENFVFYNPTKILFGRGTIPSIGPESKLLGTKALLVYGRESIKKTGIHQTITTALNQHGVEYVEHPGVRSNPVLAHVREGIVKAKEHGVDLVIAAGGGSVLDSAKAICAGAVVEHDV
ncbi:MAG: iron-containing alcohol dehydrogenase, partial [Desulfobulbaceae bacterium]|nr:iron-containing alcohol dehydrogenase [Desulfobulbaceae bacterium]